MNNKKVIMVDQIDEQFPKLRDLIESLVGSRPERRYAPPSMQLKSKTSGMIYAIVTASETLKQFQLDVPLFDVMDEVGDVKIRQLYHAFVVGNPDDRNAAFDDNAVAYVAFPDGKLPLLDAIVLFCIITAIKEQPASVGTRAFLNQIKRWLGDYQNYLANRLKYVMQ